MWVGRGHARPLALPLGSLNGSCGHISTACAALPLGIQPPNPALDSALRRPLRLLAPRWQVGRHLAQEEVGHGRRRAACVKHACGVVILCERGAQRGIDGEVTLSSHLARRLGIRTLALEVLVGERGSGRLLSLLRAVMWEANKQIALNCYRTQWIPCLQRQIPFPHETDIHQRYI